MSRVWNDDDGPRRYSEDRGSGETSKSPDEFARLLGQLHGLPDVAHTKESHVKHIPPLGIGGDETYLVQTYRQRDVGDTIFFTHVAGNRATRIVIPPKVADLIARQRDQLTSQVRSKASKEVARLRKEAGIQPGFMKGKKKKGDSQ